MFGMAQKDTAPQMRTMAPTRTSVPYKHLTVRASDEESRIFYTSDGKEFYLGACYVGAPMGGADASTIDRLRSGLSLQLPSGSYIQIGLLSSPDVESYITRYMERKTDADDFSLEICKQHAEFIASGVDEPLVQRSGILLNHQRLLVTIKVPCMRPRATKADIAAAREYADRLYESMKAAGMHLEMLDATGYLVIMRLITNLWGKPETEYDDHVPLREQVYYPTDSIDYSEKNTISFHGGEYFAKVMSVKFFPRRASLGIMNHMIGDPHGLSNQITEPYYMVLTLRYPDQIQKKDWVKRRSAMINHQVFGPTAHLIPLLGYKKNGIDTLVHEIEGKSSVVCEANFTLFIFSRARDRLTRLSAGLQAYYSSLKFEMREDKRILEPLWNNLLPLNTTTEGTKNLFRFQTMAVSHAVQFLPIFGESGSGRSGTSLFVSRRGQPILFDLFNSTSNFNGVIFAESGGGKSFLTQRMISDYLAEGAKIWVIDSGRSYEKLASAERGQFIEFSPESNICLNPFTFVGDHLEEEMDILKAIIAKMAAPEEVLDDYRMSLLEQAITSVYTNKGSQSTITDVASFCIQQADEAAVRLGKQLYPFAGGSYTRWFDGDNNLNMDNAFVVLELSELKSRKALQQVILLQLMSRINHEMFLSRGRKKIFIIDEAWEMLDDPVMGKAMESVYRKAKKDDGAVLVVTQSVADLYASPNARAIADNSAWQIILQQKSESIDSVIAGKQFKIDAYGAYMLKSVHILPGKYAELMIKRSENDWNIVRLIVNKFTGVLFSTSGDSRRIILDDLKAGKNAIDSVNEFMLTHAD